MAKSQGPQKDFQLHTIGWQAFQDLVCTVSEVEFDRVVQRVAKTSDEGRDGFFYGLPEKPLDEKDDRETTIQCKHTVNGFEIIKKTSLKKEFISIEKLVKKGKADGYILFTNAKITEGNRTNISDEIKAAGVAAPQIHGSEWLSEKILQHPKVRALVPRVYGLGDLGWITDERSRRQAEAIIASMGGDLACYVPTEAHRKAVGALNKHRVAVLLGDPAVGKSTIAAALAAAATDEAKCEVFFIRTPEEFLDTWDPTLPNRLFWIDDAFGAIQYRPELMDRWNKVLTSFRAATEKGNRFIITSRSYIWRQAIRELKNGVFPPLNTGKVVVNVESLTLAEKERILYNHLKFGKQSPKFLKECVPFLDKLAQSSSFRPEMARRLGDPAYTSKLTISNAGIQQFFENAADFLLDTLRDLDRPLQAALGLIFIENSRVDVPVDYNESSALIEKCYGCDIAELGRSLSSLEGSFVTKLEEGDDVFWTFKHPTIADTFSKLIAEESELVELYVEGGKLVNLLGEVRCGEASVEGSFVAIPASLFEKLVERLTHEGADDFWVQFLLQNFLVNKCGDKFFNLFIHQNKSLDMWDGNVDRPTSRSVYAKFIIKAARLGCLPSEVRSSFIDKLAKQIRFNGDVDFLLSERDFEEFLTKSEREMLKGIARDELVKDFDSVIEFEADTFDPDNDPDYHFDDLKYQLGLLEDLFPGDNEVSSAVNEALRMIEEQTEVIKFGVHSKFDDFSDSSETSEAKVAFHGGRSIFDDLA